MGLGGLLKPPQHVEGIVLNQVYPTSESETATNIDVIALHGLDTNSSETWTWKHRGNPEQQGVNWLKDPCMLPKRIPTARIFTCDWPASIFQEKHTIQMTMKELARRLLLSIRSRLDPCPTRPILFIASCLGGIVLTQAMAIASDNGSEYEPLWRETRGIVFLATPFGGTSFKDIAQLAVRILEIKAYFTGTVVTNLLASLQGSDQFLQELVAKFTSICVQPAKAQSCQLAIFYETKMSNPYRKAMPEVIADLLNKPKLLVDSSSARLHIVRDPIALDRTHIMMNKFAGPEDNAFNDVSGQIKFMVDQIIKAQPIEKAKNWIYYRRYLKKLNIERLSGDLLPMNRCYINLGIVIQPSNQTKIEEVEDGIQKSSPFSLSSRLKIETHDEGKEITLPTLFEAREASRGQIRPNRIMIWGRAGIGKTTLCKKIVYEFIHNDLWRDLYDIVLWVPLRNLKHKERCNIPGYNLNHLLRHEFFSQSMECDELADSLWHAIGVGSCKALFILDGLDEVSSHLNGDMLDFLNTLLNQSNIIVTSRPNATIPGSLDPFDLRLETVGFYPDQVEAYIKNAFTDLETGQSNLEKIDAVQSFLNRHHLVQTLVRIPIQLDAFCYIWNNSSSMNTTSSNMLETMTAIYQRITNSLWEKDAKRLAKWEESKFSNVLGGNIREATHHETRLLEYLAFNGMYSDIIEFEPEHRNVVIESQPQNGILLDDMLGRVSFLRSSDHSPKRRDRNYHFLHLTFQECFAAQYFVRQWEARGSLDCLCLRSRKHESFSPTRFLQRFKYNARFDIFWRFVAGLLNNNTTKETEYFFQVIQDEPRDLLGPTHQRLVMNCLSEVSQSLPLRTNLEDELVPCIIFELQLWGLASMLLELELRAEVLEKVVRKAPDQTKTLLNSLSYKRALPEIVDWVIEKYLDDEDVRSDALGMLRFQAVAEEHLPAIKAALEDKNRDVRSEAISALSNQLLAEEYLPAIIKRLEDRSESVRDTAVRALQSLPVLAEENVQNIMTLFTYGDNGTRSSALRALEGRPVADEYLPAIFACLKNENRTVRFAALEVLLGQPFAEKHFPTVIAHLEDEDDPARSDALNIIRKHSAVEDYRRSVLAYLEGKNSNKRVQRLDLELLRGELLAQVHLQAIAKLFRDEDYHVRRAAVEAIQDQPNLSIEFLRAIAKLFRDEDYHIRRAAVKAIQGQPNLSIEFLRAIAALFKDEDQNVREAAVEVFESQHNLSMESLQAVAALFKDEDRDIRYTAVEVFKNQHNLSMESLQAVAALFKDEDQNVREAAVKVFKSQHNLSMESLQAVAALLKDENWNFRRRAVKVFKSQHNLSMESLQAVAALFKDEDRNVRYTAVEVFKNQHNLSIESLQAVAALFKDEDWNFRGKAVEVFKSQNNLSMEFFPEVAALFKDKHSIIRSIAADIFLTRRALSSIPNQHIKPFYEALLAKSFREHIVWQVIEGTSYITMGDQEYSVNWPRSVVRRAQRKCGIPFPFNSTDSRASRLLKSLRQRSIKRHEDFD
ncbi:armadillo-type protein [Xylaria curta]|nr:armadillo-type protein [Xylaria curta]